MKPLAGKTGNSSLTEADVRQIRRVGATTPTRQIAEAYGIGVETVRKIIRRDTWQWVTDAVSDDVLMERARESEARIVRLMEGQVTAQEKVKTSLSEIAGGMSAATLERLRLFTEVAPERPKGTAKARVIPPSPMDGGDGGIDETGGAGVKMLVDNARGLLDHNVNGLCTGDLA